MTIYIQRFFKQILFTVITMSMLGSVANAAESKIAVLNEYEIHGFQCLDISQTINEDTLKSYTDLAALENSDKVHVCVRVDLTEKQITGNKYVFVFDQNDNMKTYGQIASILD